MAGLSRLGVRPIPGSTFDLNLRARTALLRSVAGGPALTMSPDALLSVARAGNARTMDLGSVATLVGPNAPRYAYHPVSGAGRGLAVERPVSNLLLNSNALDAGTWVLANATVAPNADTALDGTQTADVVTETSNGARGSVSQAVAVASSIGALIWMATVRPIAGTTNLSLGVALTGGTASSGSVDFDLVNGVVLNQAGSAAGFIEPGPRGSWRIGVLIFNINNASLTASIGRTNVGDAAPVYSVSDAGVLNQTRFPIVPLQTTGAAASKASDDVRLPLATQPWFNPAQGTFIAEFELLGDPGATPTIFAVRLSDTENLWVYRAPSPNGRIICASNTAAGGATLTLFGVDSLPARVRLAYSYKAGQFAAAMSGGTVDYLDGNVAVASAGAVPAGLGNGTLFLGSFNGNGWLDGCLGRLAYRPYATAPADLSALVR